MKQAQMTENTITFKLSGWTVLIAIFLIILMAVLKIYGLVNTDEGEPSIYDIYREKPFPWMAFVYGISTVALCIFLLVGLKTLQVNEAIVYTFMGNYKGTLRGPGFFWVPSWWGSYSLRDLAVQTFSVEQIAVNDKMGNPIFIGCDIFAKEKDTCVATFSISDLESYLTSKSEVALRKLATKYPMDAHDEEISLRGSTDRILEELQKEIATEFEKAGYEVEMAAITKLVYAPEIAAMMLQKQQAQATIDARKKIAEGAATIVMETIESLEKDKKITLSSEEKGRAASNLLMVLCSHHSVSPVIQV